MGSCSQDQVISKITGPENFIRTLTVRLYLFYLFVLSANV